MRQLTATLMKRVTWLVLVAYTVLMFKPVMPVVMDVLAHTFWEQQHMLTVHEVNGKFHVHNELVKASHQSEKDKQAAGNKYAMGEYLPVISINKAQAPSKFYFKKDTYRFYSCFYPFSCHDIDNPPPEA